MKDVQRINGNRFPPEIRDQVLKEYNTPSLWTGKSSSERQAALNTKYKLGTGTLTYWLRKQPNYVQPRAKKAKPTTLTVQPKSVVPANQHREGELLLRSAQRSLDSKRPSELTAFELTTLLALRIFEGKG